MEMQESVSWILAAAGALALLAGLFGGGFELKELKLPRLSTASRAMSMIAGIVLLSIVAVPPLLDRGSGSNPNGDPAGGPLTPSTVGADIASPGPTTESPGAAGGAGATQQPPPVEPPQSSAVVVPPLIGLTRDAAVALIEDEGLVPGNISTREVWATHGTVYAQSPASGESVAEGDQVDLTIADSEFVYTATRSFTTEDDNLSATVTYEASLIDSGAPSQSALGTFSLRRASVSGADGDFDAIVERLLDEPGYVELDRLQDLDLQASWDVYNNVSQDTQTQLELSQIGNSDGKINLSPAVMLALAGTEVSFDVKVLFAAKAPDFVDSQRFVLEESDALLSSDFRIEGPGSVTDAGRARRYDIMRRAPDANDYRRAGDVVYRVEDGALQSLNLRYRVGDSDSPGFYSLEIEQL